MDKSERDFVSAVFWSKFMNWMDMQYVSEMYETLKDDIIKDIEECADKDFTSGDVDIAIRRVLFKKIGIED